MYVIVFYYRTTYVNNIFRVYKHLSYEYSNELMHSYNVKDTSF
jgi:hypothetical protein